MIKFFFIWKEFAFLRSDYGFKIRTTQIFGDYHCIVYTNGKKKIMVSYDDLEFTDDKVRIEVKDAYEPSRFINVYTDTDRYRSEFGVKSDLPKEKIHGAAVWLKDAIEKQFVVIE